MWTFGAKEDACITPHFCRIDSWYRGHFVVFLTSAKFEMQCQPDRNLPKPRLSHEDQLDILDRRAKLLEMILEIPPRTYTKHPTTDGTDGGLMNKPLTHNFFKDRVMRNKNSFLAKASRYGYPTRVEKDAS